MEILKIIRSKLLDWSVKWYWEVTGFFFLVLLGLFFFRSRISFTSVAGIFIVGLNAILALFWFCYCGWHFTLYRYVAYFFSWLYYLFRRILTNRWTKFILLFLSIQLIPWLTVYCPIKNQSEIIKDVFAISKQFFIIKKSVTLLSMLIALGVTIFISFIFRLIKANQYFFITGFEDFTKNKIEEKKSEKEEKGNLHKAIEGIPAIFQYELGRVIYLLKNFEESRYRASPKRFNVHEGTPSKKYNIVEYVVDIKDIKDFQVGINPDSYVKMGSFLTIPFGWLVKAFSRLMYGPIISGSIHKEGNNFILIASIRGGGYNRNWRLYSNEVEGHENLQDSEKINKLAALMACRILGEIQDFGSPNWRAVKPYIDALLNYREAILSNKDKLPKLQKARILAEQAICKDKLFPQCYYNLGNIYLEMGKRKAAEVAFRKALEIKPDYARCYYELAQIYYWDNKFADAAWFCEQATNQDPTEAIYWNLRGVVQFDENNGKELKEVSKFFMKASALSWKTLCKSIKKEGKNSELKLVKQTAALCLLYLTTILNSRLEENSNALLVFSRDKTIRLLFNQALFLKPTGDDIYFEKGKYFFAIGKREKAYLAFRKIFEDNPDISNIEFWAHYLNSIILKLDELTNERSGKNEEENEVTKLNKEQCIAQITRISNLFLDAIAYLLHIHSEVEPKYDQSEFEFNIDLLNFALDEIDFDVITRMMTEPGKKPGPDKNADPDLTSLKFIMNLKDVIEEYEEDNENEDTTRDFFSNLMPVFKEKPFKKWRWAIAQKNIIESDKIMAQNDKKHEDILTAIQNLKIAIDNLKGIHSREIIMLGLYAKIAEAYLTSKNYDFALLYALYAFGLNPFSNHEQTVLREAYVSFKASWGLQNIEEFESSFRLSLSKKDILREAGELFFRLIKEHPVSDEKIKIRERAIYFFDEASKIMKVEQSEELLASEEGLTCLTELGIIHYYFGLIYNESNDYDRAIQNFKEAAKYGYEPQTRK